MTTLKRELIQTIKKYFNEREPLPAFAESWGGSRYHISDKEAEGLADAISELRAFQNKESMKEDLAKKSFEASILMGVRYSPDQDLTAEQEKEIEALESFERDMKFNPLPWGSTKAWERLAKFIVAEIRDNPQIFFKYKSWQEGDGMFDAMKNKQIYDDPLKFIATFPEFKKTLVKKSVSEPKVDDHGAPISY